MGLFSRFSYVIRSKVNSLLNRAEDPNEMLDYSYEQMNDELQEVKKGISDLVTQKKRLEIQYNDLEEEIEHHNTQAREAVQQDRDDLATKALEKKKNKMSRADELSEQIQDLEQTQAQLVEKKNELESRIEEFKTQKEVTKSKHKAAEAEVNVRETLSGVGDNNIAQSIERAEDNVEEQEARAEALDELEESDAFESALNNKSSLDAELDTLTTDSEVSDELASLKEESSPSNDSELSVDEIEQELDEEDKEMNDESHAEAEEATEKQTE